MSNPRVPGGAEPEDRRPRLSTGTVVALAEARDVLQGMQQVLHIVCDELGLAVGQLWRPRPDRSVMECSPVSYFAGESSGEFRRASENLLFKSGADMIGRVWNSRAVQWIGDVTADEGYARGEAAARERLRSAIFIPIVAHDEVVFVAEFYSRVTRIEEEGLEALLGRLSSRWGRVLEGRMATGEGGAGRHARRYFLERPFREAVFHWDLASDRIQWSRGVQRLFGESPAEENSTGFWWRSNVHPEDAMRVFSVLESMLHGRQDHWWIQYRFRRDDGSYWPVWHRGLVLRDAQGVARSVIGSMSDALAFPDEGDPTSVIKVVPRGPGTPPNDSPSSEGDGREIQVFGRMQGRSAPMRALFHRLRLAAKTDAAVLLTGESGTGKELAARAIHDTGGRGDRAFLAVNCTAIPDTLLESELFGHVRGSFTGAVRDRIGLFETAHGGTLFLDEVGDMSPLMQLKLLRVLQEKEIRRVGDDKLVKVNVRIIAASNRDLEAAILSGGFREDLYYRIRVFEARMPPLRERREDIPVLVEQFVMELSEAQGMGVVEVDPEAMERCLDHTWPGNVRELRNAIEHAFVTMEANRITVRDLPVGLQRPPAPSARPKGVAEADRSRILEALRIARGNRTAAARRLGYSRVTLWNHMKRLQISFPTSAPRES